MPAAGGIISGIGALTKIGMGIHQNNLARKVVIPDATYNSSQYAANNLGTAENMFNGRMAGAGTAEQNILNNGSNTEGAIQRNSTSGAQSLATAMASQGQTDSSLQHLGQQEGNYKMNMLNNLNMANNGMTMEGDKVYNDKVRKQNLAIGEKNSLRGAGFQNIGTGINEMGATANMLAQGPQNTNY